MLLDRKRAFGTISGETFIPDGSDIPARYEQDGRFFDSHGRLIGAPSAVADVEPAPASLESPALSVAELLASVESMSWPSFRAAAQRTLGPDCPGTKSSIIEALHAAQREFDDRGSRRAQQSGRTPPQKSQSSIDVAAWAMGRKEYLWSDIRKALKAEYGRNFAERDDAVEFLVTEGVVPAALARQDVIRDPGAAPAEIREQA